MGQGVSRQCMDCALGCGQLHACGCTILQALSKVQLHRLDGFALVEQGYGR